MHLYKIELACGRFKEVQKRPGDRSPGQSVIDAADVQEADAFVNDEEGAACS